MKQRILELLRAWEGVSPLSTWEVISGVGETPSQVRAALVELQQAGQISTSGAVAQWRITRE